MRPIEVKTLTLTDGEERKFLLTMGGVNRLKKSLGANFAEILKNDATAAVVPILHEAMLNKNGMTEDQFADLLPAYLEDLVKFVAELVGLSLPEPNPPSPTPTE